MLKNNKPRQSIVTTDLIERLRRAARGLVKPSEIDDLVQDTLARILEKEHLETPQKVAEWAVTVLYHVNFNRIRDSRRMMRDASITKSIEDIALLPALNFSPSTQIIYVELSEAFGTILSMPKNWRSAIVLAAQDYTVKDISEKLGVHRHTVEIWLANARRVLCDPSLLGTKISFRGLVLKEHVR